MLEEIWGERVSAAQSCKNTDPGPNIPVKNRELSITNHSQYSGDPGGDRLQRILNGSKAFKEQVDKT